MAATVTSPWNKPGAWALDSEQHEEELTQQHKKDESAAATTDFPSLSAAATTKTKKKKPQPMNLAEFSTYDPVKSRESKLTHEDMMNLPKGPRERTAEELERNRGFRSYGTGGGGRGSDEPRRPGSFNRDSNKEPSRADENDNWGSVKKSGGGGGGFERRERGGFFENSQSKADESDNWVSNKSYVPSDGGRRYERQRIGFESSGGADSDNWGKKKEVEGRKFGAFDSLRERRGGGFDSGNGGGNGNESWGKSREEVGSVRPKLNLQPRKAPIEEKQDVSVAAKPKGSNPFGDARPREEVLKEKGQDWKEVDEKLESLKLKEKEAGLADGPGRRSFGSGKDRNAGNGDKSERSWRKPDAVDVRPQSAENAEGGENGHAEEALTPTSEN